MKIEHVTRIKLTPDELKEIIKSYFKAEYKINNVEFVIGTLPDDDSLYSSYQMTQVELTASKLELDFHDETELKLSWT